MDSSEPSAEVALALMERALGVLDECNTPGDIGGHLDLAIERLYEHLGRQRDVDDQLVA